MYVSVDNDKCSGHARCAAVSEELFTLDDDGYCNIGKDRPVPPDMETTARAGADSCPEGALVLHEWATAVET